MRRRPFGRRPVVPGARASLHARRRLRQAHNLFEQGRFRQAADWFLKLASGAEGLGLDRAPFLYLQAGRARVLATEVDTGLRLLRRGFEMLAEGGSTAQLAPLGQRAVAELERLGHPAYADELKGVLADLTELSDWQAASGEAVEERQLPGKCAQCGANLFPEDLELRGGVPICSYCGSPVEAEA